MQLRRLAIVGTAIAALGALLIAVVLIDGPDQSSDALPGTTTDFSSGYYTGDLLTWSGRDRLAVCVELSDNAAAVTGLTEGEVVTLVDAALRGTATDSYWNLSERLQEAVASSYADYGCPIHLDLDCPRIDLVVTCTEFAERVSVPSKYKVFAYVLTDSEFALATGIRDGYYSGRRGSAEFTCELDSCAEVTGSVYLTFTELMDVERLDFVLREGLGLVEFGAPPPEELDRPSLDGVHRECEAQGGYC